MGIDEAIMNSVRNGGKSTIRFYKWKPSAVSIGRFQSMEEEVDIEACKSNGIDYVRRITGGGTVFHSSFGEITYSVISREEEFKDIMGTYREICGWIVDALYSLGITASFSPINDITVNGKKISGNAQARKGNVMLQHGTILYDLDPMMFKVLRVGKEKLSDKGIASPEERVTSVKNFSRASMDELYRSLLSSFSKGKEYAIEGLSEKEVEESKELIEKYASYSWNFER
ncbi:MAG: biotin/lipoate A/B protein ligase family protein [Candidatus Micrarchaeaceae archaeon]